MVLFYTLLGLQAVEMFMMIENFLYTRRNRLGIISHSLGSASGQQINNDYGNVFRSRSYGSPFVSGQRPEDTGTNLRIRKAGDPVGMFD